MQKTYCIRKNEKFKDWSCVIYASPILAMYEKEMSSVYTLTYEEGCDNIIVMEGDYSEEKDIICGWFEAPIEFRLYIEGFMENVPTKVD